MKNKLKFIIILLLLIISIIIIIIHKHSSSIKALKEADRNTELKKVIEGQVKNPKDFFAVQECVNKYFEILNKNDSEGVYNLLNSKYVEKNEIDISNVLQKVYKLENGFEEFFAKQIYFKEIDSDLNCQYYVYGEILGENYDTIQTIYIIANIDFVNNTFNIIFSDKVEVNEQEYFNIIENIKNKDNEELNDVRSQDTTSIELNEYNVFNVDLSEEQYGLYYYLKNYTIMAAYYPDIAYNLLDEEYRNKRFGSLEEYKEYILKNKSKLANSTIKEYSVAEKDGYYQYIIIDTNGNYYIFKVTDIMKYTLLTDFYTIELEEIANNYDNSNVQERVAINIQKVVSALKNKDYKYVYGKLAEEFKANKYPTLESFENYISTLIIGNPDLILGEFRNEGETYIYNITLESSRASAGDPVNMQIIMQLKENRDFVMSFNVQ